MMERDIVKKIMDYLRLRGCIAWKYHGGAYSTVGHSDIYGVLPDGRAFFIEVKVPGKKPTRVQEIFIENAAKNNAVSFWTDSLEDAKQTVDMFLK